MFQWTRKYDVAWPIPWATDHAGRGHSGWSRSEVEPWLDAIRHLFIEGCRVLPVFYAAAYVCQNVIAKGRSLRYDGQSESGPMGLLSWNGILREPMWLTYLGPQLAQLLNDGPNWADWTPSGNGALIQSSRTPRPSRDLVGVVPPLPDSLASASRAIDPDA